MMKLEVAIKKQIQQAWGKLEKPIHITLERALSNEKDLEKYRDFLGDILELSPKISYEEIQSQRDHSRISLSIKGESSKIHFEGLPLGHELTSFVLAPLMLGGGARMPDKTTVKRILQLQGALHIKTTVSLSCENCPGVVQALNTIAAIHPTIEHSTIDGGVFPERTKAQGVLSVPTVHFFPAGAG